MNGRRLVITFIISVVFCIGFELIIKSYARYSSYATGEASLTAALFVATDNMSETLSFKLDDMKPGDVKNYYFNVANFEGDNVAEVKISYDITLLKSDNIPFTVKLYKNGANVDSLTNLTSTNNIMLHGIKTTDTYRLELTWNNTNNSSSYQGLTDYLDIVVESEQVIS